MDLTDFSEGPNERLIVLIPQGTVMNSSFAQKIYQMARREQCDVLFLAFHTDEDDRLAMIRSISTLTAITMDDTVRAESKVCLQNQWLRVLREVYHPGDRIVCHEEQMANDGFLRTTPVRDVLFSIFHGPITTVSGFYHPWEMLSRKWLYTLIFWVGCLLILFGFGILEIAIDGALHGGFRSFLLLMVAAVEIGALWLWNRVPKF